MILVAEFLQIIASNHKARAERFEVFAFPQKIWMTSYEKVLRASFMPLSGSSSIAASVPAHLTPLL
jgi:hypothetical protein